MFDNQVKSNPISVATFPEPTDKDYLKVGGHFGPHNIHENRPGSFQSEELIFATYQNAGVRVYDIRNQLRPQEVAGFVSPTPPARWVDRDPIGRVLHSADVYVDKNGLLRDRLQRRPLCRPIRRLRRQPAELSPTRCRRKPGERGFEMATTDVPAPSHAHYMRLIGHTDQERRNDGQQIMVQNGHAYIGHVCSRGFGVVDVRDPTRPKTVGVENPPNTWSLHLQVHDDLLLLVHGQDANFSQQEMADERNYYKPKAGRHDDHATPQRRNWSAGMAVFDISEPAAPIQIGFMPVEAPGCTASGTSAAAGRMPRR